MEHNISDKVMLQRKQSLHPSIQSMLRLIHFTFTLLEDDTTVQPVIILGATVTSTLVSGLSAHPQLSKIDYYLFNELELLGNKIHLFLTF